MRRAALPPLAIAIGIACAACSGSGGKGAQLGKVTIQLVVPPAGSPDPMQGAATFTVSVLDSAGTVVATKSFGASQAITMPGLPQGTHRTVTLEAFDSGNTRISHGRTLPFDFVDGQTLTLSMYFARSNSFNAVHGTDVARIGASAAVLGDGRVLIAGGLVGTTASTAAEVYDPIADSAAATGAMGAGHSFTSAVALDPNVILVAAGLHDTSGTPAGAADVFVYDSVSHAGAWAPSVPAMATPRRNACGAALGGDRAVVAGGSDAGGTALDTVEVFTWGGTGASSSWTTPGNAMANPRDGCIALPVAADIAAIGGGGDLSGGGGATNKDMQLFHATGGTFNNGGQLSNAAQQPAVLPLSATSWLIAGGIGTNNGQLSTKTSLVTWNGSNTSSSNGPSLPNAQRRGGGGIGGDGRALLVGGDTDNSLSGFTPVDAALAYDVAGGSITALGTTAGATASAVVIPLGDQTSLVVTDLGARRYNP